MFTSGGAGCGIGARVSVPVCAAGETLLVVRNVAVSGAVKVSADVSVRTESASTSVPVVGPVLVHVKFNGAESGAPLLVNR